jgi:hypothetical protein
MKQLFRNVFSMWFDFPYKEVFNFLLWAFKLYLLVLAPYLTVVVLGFIFSILCGGNFIDGVLSFTRAYFYDGYLLDFIAWRVHLTWLIVCFFICLNEEL